MANTQYAAVTNFAGGIDYYEIEGFGYGNRPVAESLLTDATNDGHIASYQVINNVPAGNMILGYTEFRLLMCEIMLGLD